VSRGEPTAADIYSRRPTATTDGGVTDVASPTFNPVGDVTLWLFHDGGYSTERIDLLGEDDTVLTTSAE